MHSAFNVINLLAMYHKGDDGHNIAISIPYLMGFVVVIVTLTVLMGLCMVIGALLQKVLTDDSTKKTATLSTVSAPVAATNTASDDAISPEILAVLAVLAAAASTVTDSSEEIYTVIAAATATMFEKPHKILYIKPTNTSWSNAGRQEVLSSHKF